MKIIAKILDIRFKYIYSCKLCKLKKIHPECDSKKKIIFDIEVEDETG